MNKVYVIAAILALVLMAFRFKPVKTTKTSNGSDTTTPAATSDTYKYALALLCVLTALPLGALSAYFVYRYFIGFNIPIWLAYTFSLVVINLVLWAVGKAWSFVIPLSNLKYAHAVVISALLVLSVGAIIHYTSGDNFDAATGEALKKIDPVTGDKWRTKEVPENFNFNPRTGTKIRDIKTEDVLSLGPQAKTGTGQEDGQKTKIIDYILASKLNPVNLAVNEITPYWLRPSKGQHKNVQYLMPHIYYEIFIRNRSTGEISSYKIWLEEKLPEITWADIKIKAYRPINNGKILVTNA